MRTKQNFAPLGFLLLGLWGCSESTATFYACEPGDSLNCVCPSGKTGVRLCLPDKSLGQCQCDVTFVDGGTTLALDAATHDLAVPDAKYDQSQPITFDSRVQTCGANLCQIENHCYTDEETNKRNSCQICDPANSPTTWSMKPFCSSTVAGSSAGFLDGPVAVALFNKPRRLFHDHYTNFVIFVTDTGNHRIRRIENGIVTTIAGTGVAGFADGPVASAKFNSPEGINVYNFYPDGEVITVVDRGNHCLRQIKNGQVSTLAGLCGTSGMVNGSGTAARFNDPSDIASDSTIGQYLVADTGNNVIRRVNQGVVNTLAGSGSAGATDGAALSATFNHPQGITAEDYNIYLIADTGNNRIRRISNGQVSTVFAATSWGFHDGLITDVGANTISDVAVSTEGILYFSDTGNSRLRRIINLQVDTFAGNGSDFADGPGREANYNHQVGIFFNRYTNGLYVADTENNRIREVQLK